MKYKNFVINYRPNDKCYEVVITKRHLEVVGALGSIDVEFITQCFKTEEMCIKFCDESLWYYKPLHDDYYQSSIYDIILKGK